MIDDGEFVNQAAQVEAARQLGWLIGSDLGDPKRLPSMLLPLCDLPLALQLEPADPPDDEVLALYALWLDEVIEPNRDLRRLGRELFCEWFLRREGSLLVDLANNRLELQASSVDVLLRHVDWPRDKVQLPWLDRTLMVDWAPLDM